MTVTTAGPLDEALKYIREAAAELDRLRATTQDVNRIADARIAALEAENARLRESRTAYAELYGDAAMVASKALDALRLARPIVEADVAQAADYADADWQGMSRAALEAVDAALAHDAEAAPASPAPRPLPTAPIARAKALCRAEGWTVNKIDGRWRVAQRGKVYHFDRAELLAFVGIKERKQG